MSFRGVDMGRNWFVATDLAKRRVDEVRVRANYRTVLVFEDENNIVMYSVPRKLLPLSYCCLGCNSCEGNFT